MDCEAAREGPPITHHHSPARRNWPQIPARKSQFSDLSSPITPQPSPTRRNWPQIPARRSQFSVLRSHIHRSQFSDHTSTEPDPQKLATNPGPQFSVLRSQFSVLSSQFSVLSSQFSVLSSQISVLSSPITHHAFTDQDLQFPAHRSLIHLFNQSTPLITRKEGVARRLGCL
jgi:hypothetical protein